MLLLSQKKIRQVAPGHARSPKESHRVHGRGGVGGKSTEVREAQIREAQKKGNCPLLEPWHPGAAVSGTHVRSVSA